MKNINDSCTKQSQQWVDKMQIPETLNKIISSAEDIVAICERGLIYCDIRTVISSQYLFSKSLAFGNWVSWGLQIATERLQM